MDDVSALIDSLNANQRDAVAAAPGNMLVLAGAGSGKTRVLVHRIAWLLQAEGVSPYAILAVTFTNKAAREMRTRLEALQGVSLRSLWVGTFHSIAHRLLRTHWHDARLPQHFQIIDSDDQLRLVKRLLRDHGVDDERFPPKQVQYFISGCKEEGLRPSQVATHGDAYMAQMVDLYERYQLTCERGRAGRFGELLLRSLELLRDNAALSSTTASASDTSWSMSSRTPTPCSTPGSSCSPGTEGDGESLHGGRRRRPVDLRLARRGSRTSAASRANSAHAHGALEQNLPLYSAILDAANALISHNTGRMGKELWTDGDAGDKISVYAGFTISTRRASSSTPSTSSTATATPGARWRCSTAPTPSRG